MKIKVMILLSVMILMAGCGGDMPEIASSPAPGRPETRGVEAAGAAGYDGAAVRRSVDKMLDQNDARNAKTAKAVDPSNRQ